MTASSPLALVSAAEWEIDSRQVPCDPRYTRPLIDRLDRIASANGRDAAQAADLSARLTAVASDANQMHRVLLAARHDYDRTGILRHAVSDALKDVRRHSHLYTRRTCACWRAAFRRFVDEFTATMEGAPEPAGWAVTHDRRGTWDFRGPLDVTGLGVACGLPPYTTVEDLTRRFANSRLRIVVTPASATGRAKVEVISGRGRLQRVGRLVALTEKELDVARMLAYGSGEPRRFAAGSELVEWDCPPLVDILADRSRDSAGTPATTAAEELLEAGFLRLPRSTQVVAARMSPGWKGTMGDLVVAASVVDDEAA